VSDSQQSEQQVHIRAVRSGEWRGYEICCRSDTHCQKHRLSLTVTYHKQLEQINVYITLI